MDHEPSILDFRKHEMTTLKQSIGHAGLMARCGRGSDMCPPERGKNRAVHHNSIEAASTQHLHNIDDADLVPSPNDIN